MLSTAPSISSGSETSWCRKRKRGFASNGYGALSPGTVKAGAPECPNSVSVFPDESATHTLPLASAATALGVVKPEIVAAKVKSLGWSASFGWKGDKGLANGNSSASLVIASSAFPRNHDEPWRCLTQSVPWTGVTAAFSRRIISRPGSSNIARRGDDGELFAAMLGHDDTATRLRESMPFVGLLPQSEVRRLHEEAAA